MNRRVVTVVALLAILFQGLSTAWAMPLSSMPAQSQTTMNAEASAMPCHLYHAASMSQTTKVPAPCCASAHCSCLQLCSMAAMAIALPTASSATHFSRSALLVAPASQPALSSAHSLLPLRPPITRSS